MHQQLKKAPGIKNRCIHDPPVQNNADVDIAPIMTVSFHSGWRCNKNSTWNAKDAFLGKKKASLKNGYVINIP